MLDRIVKLLGGKSPCTLVTMLLAGVVIFLLASGSGLRLVNIRGNDNVVHNQAIPRDGGQTLNLLKFCKEANIISKSEELELSGYRYVAKKTIQKGGILTIEELNWPDVEDNNLAVFYWLAAGEQMSAPVVLSEEVQDCMRGE